MFRIRIRPVIAIILLAFGTIAFACSGDGTPLTLEEYFQRLEAFSDQEDVRDEALSDQVNETLAGVTSDEDAVRAFEELIGLQIDSFEQFADDLDGLNPPDALDDLHEESLASLRAFLNAFRAVEDELTDLDALTALDSLFGSDTFENAEERANQACRALQNAADENGFDIDLDCDDD